VSPDAYTLQETFIEVGDGHTLYVQEWGNPGGMPIVFLHGGPGSGCKDRYKGTFNPRRHRVIFFDQRGSGRSLPYGSLENNTTNDLVEDIERIAKHLKLTHFTLYGGSWGSCLALAYGIAYPKRVKNMILNGTFTGTQAENDYFYSDIYANYFPDVWEQLLEQTPKSHHKNPLLYHSEQALHAKDKELAKKSAYIVQGVEGALLSLNDRWYMPGPLEEFDPVSAFIEIHYFLNHFFMPDRAIIKDAHKLTMPIWLIQGRYDMVCPGRTAYELHKALPNSELMWAISGHRNEHEMLSLEEALLLQLTNEEQRKG
jgi:proline iminopeptidase